MAATTEEPLTQILEELKSLNKKLEPPVEQDPRERFKRRLSQT